MPPESYLPDAVTAIHVKGFKSFADEQTIAIRPLTLLAGANSSGKSSAIQPLLLLKQTLEASYDPGPLLLDGPHVWLTSSEQLFSRVEGPAQREFQIGVELENETLRSVFIPGAEGQLDLARTLISYRGQEVVLEPKMTSAELKKLPDWVPGLNPVVVGNREILTFSVARSRCFLRVEASLDEKRFSFILNPLFTLPTLLLMGILHVPGLRGNPARAYKATGGSQPFSGTFEHYTASVIASWQEHADDRVEALSRSLEHLGLSWTVKARSIDATQIELLVGRLPHKPKSRSQDLVNVADMGFGVSQVLPVLVALLFAEPGQLVYLEQPELHLHPRAQQALASVLVDAANRGVRVVTETHSSILLLAVQTLVAEGGISPDKVKLHWFQRDARGATRVHSADMDQLGAYGDWPEDFGEARMEADSRYLTAIETRAFGQKKRAKK